MPVVKKRSVLSGITVREAMRRQVTSLPPSTTIGDSIGRMIKYKVNAVLVTTPDGQPAGVVSKTDIMGAYYAALGIDTALQDIMVGPVQICYPDDGLESALELMHANQVHRLYVLGADSGMVTGVLAYPDVIGLLYRYCRVCDRSFRRAQSSREANQRESLRVEDVMTPEVVTQPRSTTIAQVIEALAAHRFGAVLITDSKGLPVGVASKTDLVVAYRHGRPVDTNIGEIMHTAVHTSASSSRLSTAIQLMLLKDIQRIFVHDDAPTHIIGVLSLSDAVRFRSGSCRACMSGRLITSDD